MTQHSNRIEVSIVPLEDDFQVALLWKTIINNWKLFFLLSIIGLAIGTGLFFIFDKSGETPDLVAEIKITQNRLLKNSKPSTEELAATVLTDSFMQEIISEFSIKHNMDKSILREVIDKSVLTESDNPSNYIWSLTFSEIYTHKISRDLLKDFLDTVQSKILNAIKEDNDDRARYKMDDALLFNSQTDEYVQLSDIQNEFIYFYKEQLHRASFELNTSFPLESFTQKFKDIKKEAEELARYAWCFPELVSDKGKARFYMQVARYYYEAEAFAIRQQIEAINNTIGDSGAMYSMIGQGIGIDTSVFSTLSILDRFEAQLDGSSETLYFPSPSEAVIENFVREVEANVGRMQQYIELYNEAIDYTYDNMLDNFVDASVEISTIASGSRTKKMLLLAGPFLFILFVAFIVLFLKEMKCQSKTKPQPT